jgi:uncharacterized RDD family membrane protein YckC
VSGAATLRASPGIARRLACAVYELILLAAVILIATFPFLAFTGDASFGPKRHLLQAYVLVVAGAYLVTFWARGGQTLAMKTWDIRLVGRDGESIGIALAAMRYILAVAGLVAAGLGFLWALWDRDGQFLHDRLVGTRLVTSDPPGRSRA